jgi:hypothetical protein
LRLFFDRIGLRSVSELGFSNAVDAWWYAQWFRGYALVPMVITLAAFATAVIIGRNEGSHSASLFLPFSVCWSVGMVSHYTRRWPSDAV